MGQSYEKSKKDATKYILILAGITIFEVIFALTGKGHLFGGKFMMSGIIIAGAMILMSLVKAYLIVYEFMHMKYEMPGLVRSVLLPTALLIWAVVAFFYEGNDWQKRRDLIKNKNKQEIEDPFIDGSIQSGMLNETKHLERLG